jgi:hypothetical protein
MSLHKYKIPIDVIAYEILRFVSYFELDNVLQCFNLTPKEHALIKFKIYKARLKTLAKSNYIEYRIENKIHCENDPALIFDNGTKGYYSNGELHRLDGPAVEYYYGEKQWFVHNKLHRINGPAIEHANGDKEYYFNNIRHREDGPAIERTRYKNEWYLNGIKQKEEYIFKD